MPTSAAINVSSSSSQRSSSILARPTSSLMRSKNPPPRVFSTLCSILLRLKRRPSTTLYQLQKAAFGPTKLPCGAVKADNAIVSDRLGGNPDLGGRRGHRGVAVRRRERHGDRLGDAAGV